MKLESTAMTPEQSPSVAIAKGYFKQVRYLLEMGHHPNARLQDRRTPLILCTQVKDRHWRTGLARTLLEKGARVGLTDRSGLNALHFASIYECDDLVEIFLKAIDFDLNHTDKYGNTALFYAASNGNSSITSALVDSLQRYSLSIDLSNREGLTPLMQAWRKDHHECAKILMASGASLDTEDNTKKSCKDYERESLARTATHREEIEQKRQRCNIRYHEVDAWRKHQERSRSAPQLRPQHLLGAGQWREDERERRREKAMVLRDETRIIDEVSPFNHHNDPDIVFQATPAEFFGRYQRIRKISVPSRTPRPPRPKTAHPTRRNRQTCGYNEYGIDTHRSVPGGFPNDSWKRGVRGLYHHFEVQCCSSYRQTVKPSIVIDGEGQTTPASLGSGGKVLGSPIVSDTASEVTDRSRSSRKSCVLASQRGKGKIGSLQAGGPGSRVRKSSATTRYQSMESLIEDDGALSGSDSVTMRGLKMRAKSSVAGLPPRPVSRAGFSNMAPPDSPIS